MNKGLRLRYCKECGRKRFCSHIPIADYNFKYTCSQKHSWIIKGFTLERINAAIQDIFILKEKMRNLFECDNKFFNQLNKRK